MEVHYCDCIIEGGLLTHAMEVHYCDCIIEGGLLTHAMDAHYCDCVIKVSTYIQTRSIIKALDKVLFTDSHTTTTLASS